MVEQPKIVEEVTAEVAEKKRETPVEIVEETTAEEPACKKGCCDDDKVEQKTDAEVAVSKMLAETKEKPVMDAKAAIAEAKAVVETKDIALDVKSFLATATKATEGEKKDVDIEKKEDGAAMEEEEKQPVVLEEDGKKTEEAKPVEEEKTEKRVEMEVGVGVFDVNGKVDESKVVESKEPEAA